MRAHGIRIVACVLMLSGLLHAQSGRTKSARPASDKQKLIGAWHLVSIAASEAEGKTNPISGIKGTLIYTPDGHMSVQLMYPPSAAALSNDYVLNGYEASFGRYEINESMHTITHHVMGSVTRGLVGKDLSRMYQFSDGLLIIRSTRPDEHWSVTWEHD